MVVVTAEEKRGVSKRCPGAYFVRTMKQDSKRHHYYMAENVAAMRALREVREEIAKREEGSVWLQK